MEPDSVVEAAQAAQEAAARAALLSIILVVVNAFILAVTTWIAFHLMNLKEMIHAIKEKVIGEK